MKKYWDGNSLEEMREHFGLVQRKQNHKTACLFVVITVAVLGAVALAVAYFLKKEWEEEYDEEWDWDDLEDAVTEDDIDTSVKIENL